MQQLWLMARGSSRAVLSEQAFLHHPLPAHTTAISVLTCNLESLLPCTHRSYIVLLGLSYFFIHVLRDPVSEDRKSTRLNSSHEWISYAVFCLKKKTCTANT